MTETRKPWAGWIVLAFVLTLAYLQLYALHLDHNWKDFICHDERINTAWPESYQLLDMYASAWFSAGELCFLPLTMILGFISSRYYRYRYGYIKVVIGIIINIGALIYNEQYFEVYYKYYMLGSWPYLFSLIFMYQIFRKAKAPTGFPLGKTILVMLLIPLVTTLLINLVDVYFSLMHDPMCLPL